MTSLRAQDAPAKSKATRPFSCKFISVIIEINGFRYNVDPLPIWDDADRTYRLTKHSRDGVAYDVTRTRDGCVVCDCPDFEQRHRDAGTMCKHGRALVELGLMLAPVAPPAPTVEPTPVVEPTPTAEPKVNDRCYYCCRLAFLPQLDAKGRTNCYECRQERCDICERTGERRFPRADGILICGDCSKRQEEDSQRRAFVNASPYLSQKAIGRDAAQTILLAMGKEDAFSADDDYWLALLPNNREVLRTPGRGILAENSTGQSWSDPATSVLPTAPCCNPAESTPYVDCGASGESTDVSTVETPADAPDERQDVARSHLDRSATLGLAELVDLQVDFYRGWGNPAGEMLARAMEELALKIHMTESTDRKSVV